jgi:exosortase/archaeosortase family protein
VAAGARYETDPADPRASISGVLGSLALVHLARGLFVGTTVGHTCACRCSRIFAGAAKAFAQAKRSLLLPAILIVVYVVTYSTFGPLARATIAFTTLAVTTSSLRFGKAFHPGLFGLFYLSLPTLPTLQFFAGYPMRVVVAELAAPILRVGGFAVVPQGTCLDWAGQLIWIDAPCSGIKMLWVGLFLTFVVLCLYELPLLNTLLLMPLAAVVITGANVFRAVALFYLEAGVLHLPSWGHEYAGLIAFALEAAGIVSVVFMLRRRRMYAS